MVQIDKEIKIMARWLKYYDKHKHFPFEKKIISIRLTYEILDKLKGKNISNEIENFIFS